MRPIVVHRRTFTLLLSFVLVFIGIDGQGTKKLSLKFDAKDFELLKDEAGNCIVISNTLDYSFKTDTLLPALPYVGINVLISNNEAYLSHSIADYKSLICDNVIVANNPVCLPTNMPPQEANMHEIPPLSSGIYPNSNVDYVGTHDVGRYRLLSFHVCPFEYDADRKKLYLKSQIDLSIQLDKLSSATANGTKNDGNSMIKDQIRKIVVNPEDLGVDNSASSRSSSTYELIHQTGYEYVIVTSNQFKTAFQELANWKNRKGIRAKVITVEEIVPVYSGYTIQEKIKRALADIDGLQYVLLGGDTLNVPTEMCFIGIRQYTDSITPADIYYACLGNMNWNTNGNEYHGEISEVTNLFPYFCVSRAPVATLSDAYTFVNRIINYESSPNTTNWTDDILMGGNTLGYDSAEYHKDYYFYNYYVTGDSISDVQHWSQTLYNTYINPSNPFLPSWGGNLTKLYDTYSDISGDDTYDFSAVNLQTELSKGYTFVDIMTHGGTYTWTMEVGDPYSWHTSNFLNNSGYTIITTTACHTNAFDFNTTYHNHGLWCLSQHFIQNPQSGILAYWGTSRENWYFPCYYYLGDGANFDGLTYRELFRNKYHRMGIAAKEVKLGKMSLASGSTYSTTRKIWMGLNLMGDPEMPVYLEEPHTFQNVCVQFVNSKVYVDAGTTDFDICFINQADSTDYYIARDIDSNSVSFDGLNGIYDVCLTKPGYIPYTTVCGNMFLQDITLSGSKNFTTGSAMIGSDVTNKVSQGPVEVNSGSIHITANEGVTITKDFKVNQGAEFTVSNQ